MRPIPKKLREQMADDPFMKCCCICGAQPVEWHHNETFAGRQRNETYLIVPLCHKHHTGNEGVHNCKIIKQKVNKICEGRRGGNHTKHAKTPWDAV